MTTTHTKPRTTQEHMLDVADYHSLHAYVDALPEAERVAYYYANPDYMLHGHPAYLVHEADVLHKAGKRDEAVELLRRDSEARWHAQLDAQRARNAPSTGDRVAGTIVGAWGPTLYGAIGALACTVAGAPHLAVGVATVAACFATLGALCGAVSGGRS